MSTASPILQVPLHLVTAILDRVNSIRQLGTVIRSHHIFHDAFKHSPHSVVCRVIMNQIPAEVLPLVIALLESTRVRKGDYEATADLLGRLETATLEAANNTFSYLPKLSFSDYSFLSHNYEAAESLTYNFARDTIPLAADYIGAVRSSPELTLRESRRINGAFLRYQLMCNLVYSEIEYVEDDEDLYILFFSRFSPWVNRQLWCVYAYLERKVTELYEYLIAYADEYDGENKPRMVVSGAYDTHIKSSLSQGLPLLSSAVKADTYAEKLRIYHLCEMRCKTGMVYGPAWQLAFMETDDNLLERLGLWHTGVPLDSCTEEQLGSLSGPLDGAQNSPDSSLVRIWLAVYEIIFICDYVLSSPDQHFYKCGYVLWDYDHVSSKNIKEKFDRLEESHFYARFHSETGASLFDS